MGEDLKIRSIEVHNSFGVKHVKFSAGTCTVIRGANGSGKSSILRSLLYVFSGGIDAGVIRKGSDKSVISFELTNGVRITKTTAPVKPRKARKEDPDPPVKYRADIEILDCDRPVLDAPQTYIRNLCPPDAVDPGELLRIDATTAPGRKQLADTLMRLVPISFTPEEIAGCLAYRDTIASPTADATAVPAPEAPAGLEDIRKISAQVTEQRRRHGQTRDDADGAVSRLEKALPEGTQDGAALAQNLENAEEYRRSVEKAIADRKIEIEQCRGAAALEAKRLAVEAEKAVNDEIDAKIKALEAARTEKLNITRACFGGRAEKIEELTRQEYAKLEQESAPELQKAIEEATAAKDRLAQFQRAATLREEIETQLSTLRAHAWKYDRLSEVLQRLDALRLDRLSNLPVRGLEVESGGVSLDGIPWDKVNLARRVEACLEICALQAGKLPLVLLDDSEHLSTETREAIERGLVDAGYQLIRAAVSDSPLQIEVVEEPAFALNA